MKQRRLHLSLGSLVLCLAFARDPASWAANGASSSPTTPLGMDAPGVGLPVSPAPMAPVFDEDAPPRLSLPTESDRSLWRKPGFRMGLGLVYGRFYGIDGPPNANLIGPTIRMGVRLDQDWSLMSSLQYLYASGGMRGLRFAGTLEPTWHATQHLSLALGLGFGGILETGSTRPDPDPKSSTLSSSYTFPNASMPIPNCNGVGVAGLARAEWMVVMGPRSATGFAFEMDGQWTGCVDDSGRLEPDTATPIVRRQWWPHLGGSLLWGILWR
jgi:hypothetical protein